MTTLAISLMSKAMTKGAKLLEKEVAKNTGDMEHSAGTTAISGIPNINQ